MTSRISPIPAIRLKAGVLIHPLPLSQVLTLAIPLAQIRAVILADHPVANSIEGGASSDIRSMSQHDLLIPVRVRPCELEGLLAQIIYIDLVGDDDETTAKKRLLERVVGLRAKPDEPPPYPRTVGLMAVPKRPEYPGVARTAGRWLHQVLMGGGIATAVTGALLTWWLSSPPSIRAECGVAAGGNITVGGDFWTGDMDRNQDLLVRRLHSAPGP